MNWGRAIAILRPVKPPRVLMALPSPDAKKGRERPSVTRFPRARCALYRAESRHLQELRLESRCKSNEMVIVCLQNFQDGARTRGLHRWPIHAVVQSPRSRSCWRTSRRWRRSALFSTLFEAPKLIAGWIPGTVADKIGLEGVTLFGAAAPECNKGDGARALRRILDRLQDASAYWRGSRRMPSRCPAVALFSFRGF